MVRGIYGLTLNQRVAGSSPAAPTNKNNDLAGISWVVFSFRKAIGRSKVAFKSASGEKRVVIYADRGAHIL